MAMFKMGLTFYMYNRHIATSMAYMVMAYILMAYIVMAYIVMAYVVMAWDRGHGLCDMRHHVAGRQDRTDQPRVILFITY